MSACSGLRSAPVPPTPRLVVEIEELDVQLSELEVRLDRLRALYEQYFLGIERIEPSILRKDVDRRIFTLRREKIRNTGRRFKLQTLIQRYNTFQQYWQRVCREIENGTYRRHVVRAERTLGPSELLTAATRRRFGRGREKPASTKLEELGDDLSAYLSDDRLQSEEPAEAGGSARSSDSTPASIPAPRLPRAAGSIPARLQGGGPPKPPSSRAAPPKPAPSARAAPPKPDARPAAGSGSPGGGPPKVYESLELDMDFAGWDPGARRSPAAQTGPTSPKEPKPPDARIAAKRPPKSAAPSPGNSPKRPAPAPRVARTAATELTEDRLRSLHGRLNEANQKANQPQVSLNGLSRSLRAVETKLRAQYGSRKIDFEILVRNGKPVVKPIVR